MNVKVSPPIPGSARDREWALREKVMGKRPANAEARDPKASPPPFTGGERTQVLEAFGALWLAAREWWASWFELTPRARKILKRTLWVMWIVWALCAPYAAGVFMGGYVLPAWLIVRVWRMWRGAKRRLEARKARPKRVKRSITISWG